MIGKLLTKLEMKIVYLEEAAFYFRDTKLNDYTVSQVVNN